MEQLSAKEKIIAVCVVAGILVTMLAVGIVMLLRPEPTPPETAPSETAPATLPPETDPPETTAPPTLPPPEESPVGPNDFQYEGDYLTCLTRESVLGIDVSSYQNTSPIDWAQVRDAGIEFVMIRVAGRGYGKNGVLYDDDYAQQNYSDAKAAGLEVGAYFFSQAVNAEEAREEARYILEKTAHWELDMPIVYDWEYISEEARTADVDKRTLTDCTIAFCEEILAADREPMIYFNPDQSHKQMFLEELTDYKFWLAMYSDRMTYPYRVDMWQYTCEGSVPGIEGAVDINLFFPEGVEVQ